jgi:hypothetical protein
MVAIPAVATNQVLANCTGFTDRTYRTVNRRAATRGRCHCAVQWRSPVAQPGGTGPAAQ